MLELDCWKLELCCMLERELCWMLELCCMLALEFCWKLAACLNDCCWDDIEELDC